MKICGITITNPDKILFENITKKDVVSYYHSMAKFILPHLKNRPLSVVRFHGGILDEKFYKRHLSFPGEGEVFSFGDEDYFFVKNKRELIMQAQLGTIEFHPWGCKVSSIDQPDTMVFDLDPDVGVSLEAVREGALDLKAVLDDLGLRSFLKTSGGKGYHIVVPICSPDYQSFHDFSQGVARLLEIKWPKKYTTNIRKSARRGKIFVDYMRNSQGSTSVCPYSLRAKKGASVSAPIFWEELGLIAPDEIKMSDMQKRVALDPWKDFFKITQKLTTCKK